jgi:hypothetical protein
VTVWGSAHLTGRFNAHFLDALFIHADEYFTTGDKEAVSVLNRMVTAPTLMIERKGVDPFPIPNRLKLMLSSNHDWAVPATADERRFAVLDVSPHKIGDRAYFNALAAAIEGDETSALLHHLLNLDISSFVVADVPQTRGLSEQKLLGGNSVELFWYACLCEGEIVCQPVGEWSRAGWQNTIKKAALREAYATFCQKGGYRDRTNEVWFSRRLAKLLPGEKVEDAEGNKSRELYFKLPSLEDARAAFLVAMKIPASTYPWGPEA